MANSADTDQSALGLHCLPRPLHSTLFAQNAVVRVIMVFYRYHGHNMAELLTCLVYLCIVIKFKTIITSCSFSIYITLAFALKVVRYIYICVHVPHKVQYGISTL